MMQLLIQGLRKDYEAIDKALGLAFDSDYCKKETMENAYGALYGMLRTLILSSASYQGMTNATDIAHQCTLDMQYITGCLSQEEMKQREEWHWERILEQNPLPKD